MNIYSKILLKLQKIIFIILATITKANLTQIGYCQKGISRSGNSTISGEKFVIENILKKYYLQNSIFFDVGSNEGEYSAELISFFPDATIYSFEANIHSYNKISESIKKNKQINFINIGLSSEIGEGIIYDYSKNIGSQHASIYKEVLTDIHKDNEYSSIEFKKDTLDNFCFKNKIEKINFIKIDTEGSEFDILIGAKQMIENDKIDIIQFEFNEMNIISRIFLKDYYDLLKNYNLFRITSKKIIPLPKYDPENEIFKYQNFLAINKNI